MKVERHGWQAVLARARRPALVALMISAAVSIPSWLYHTRGRRLPIAVALTTKRYIVGPDQTIEIYSRLLPATADVERYWQGPGINGNGQQGATLRWQTPHEAGVYKVALRVRRSASYAEDAISIQVIPIPFEKLEPVVDPEPERLPDWPECPNVTSPVTAQIVARGCPGQRIIVKIEGAKEAWAYPVGAPSEAWRGSQIELRLPRTLRDKPELTIVDVRRAEHCVVSKQHVLDFSHCPAPSESAKKDALEADFQWELISLAGFRLRARPQPGARYLWQLDAKTRRETKLPLLAHEFSEATRYHLVTLTVISKTRRAVATRLLVDRTIDE